MNRETVDEILRRLEAAYPDARCALDHKNVYELLVSTVLSAQTTDKSVNKVTPALFSAYPDPEHMAQADPDDVAAYIRTIGMYRQKSKHIVALSKMLVEEFGGKVPQDMTLLQKLPGVGRKTANVVLADGFGEPHIAVDTHVFRVSNRIGLAHGSDVRETEEQLMEAIPKERWTDAHHMLIFHGRNCCSARKPKCQECPVKDLCEFPVEEVR
ncbi:MAG: endonuclease III [Anaerovoracaceae bacterium]|jgi:endonuclease-3